MEQEPQAQPGLIFERLSMVQGELPAIGKDRFNQQQGFKFRGVDDVLNALNPLLSKYSVFFSPTVLERVVAQRSTRNGGIMYEVNLHVQYTFFTDDGSHFTATAWGEGTDSGDKATNKAMTLAMKNVLLQVFSINTTDNQDPDDTTPEETTGRQQEQPRRSQPAAEGPPPADDDAVAGGWDSEQHRSENHRALATGVKSLPEEQQELIREHRKNSGLPWPMTLQQFNDLIDFIEVIKAEAAMAAGEPAGLDDEDQQDEEPEAPQEEPPAKKAAPKKATAAKKAAPRRSTK